MERLIAEYANKKLHPIESAVLFHLKFEGIHHFVDGNGRTGRLILNLMLVQNGYPPVDVKFADRKRYYEALDSYHRDGDAGAMVIMVAEYAEEELERYLNLPPLSSARYEHADEAMCQAKTEWMQPKLIIKQTVDAGNLIEVNIIITSVNYLRVTETPFNWYNSGNPDF